MLKKKNIYLIITIAAGSLTGLILAGTVDIDTLIAYTRSIQRPVFFAANIIGSAGVLVFSAFFIFSQLHERKKKAAVGFVACIVLLTFVNLC